MKLFAEVRVTDEVPPIAVGLEGVSCKQMKHKKSLCSIIGIMPDLPTGEAVQKNFAKTSAT
jgi:hypothetical protein